MVVCSRYTATSRLSSSGSIAMMVRIAAIQAFMIVRLALTATMLVTATRSDERLVLRSVDLGQLADEGNHAPDIFVAHTLTPGRHACCFDSMLNDPEGGCRACVNTDLGQVRRGWIQRLTQLCLFDTGRQMAPNAHGVVVPGPATNESLVI